MAARRSDPKTGDPVDEDSSAGRPLNEDHDWMVEPDEDDEPDRAQIKVGRVRLAKVSLARGARKRR